MLDLRFESREVAGHVLGQKLKGYQNSRAIVIGIPRNGISVAAEIARYLSLPLGIIPCRLIKHPGDQKQTLGSVSLSVVILKDSQLQIPQDYVSHQVAMLKTANRSEQNFYYDNLAPPALKYKTVIIANDLLLSTDLMLACIREVKTYKPLKIIVAVPIVNAEAARVVAAEVDDIQFLRMDTEISDHDYYIDQSDIDKHQVKGLLQDSMSFPIQTVSNQRP